MSKNTLPTGLERLLDALPPDSEFELQEMAWHVCTKLPELPELFECSMLFEQDEWDAMPDGERRYKGKLLAQIACMNSAPFHFIRKNKKHHNQYTVL